MTPSARMLTLATLAAIAGVSVVYAAVPAPAAAPTAPAASAPVPASAPAPVVENPPIGTAKLLLSEDFENTAKGEIPKGFTKTGSVGVVDDVAHSGKKSLRMDASPKGSRRITTNGDFLKELGGEHWGRLYFKVETPFPIPASGVVHSTLVAGSALSPQFHDPIEVRVLDTVMNNKGAHQYIYNVQPKQRNEFGKGGAYDYKYTDKWQLAEWYIDFATQSYRLFIDGKEIKDVALNRGAGNFQRAEIPEVFESLSFGWYNYQVTEKGFTAWIDDIALSKERIGTRGLPEEAKKGG